MIALYIYILYEGAIGRMSLITKNIVTKKIEF